MPSLVINKVMEKTESPVDHYNRNGDHQQVLGGPLIPKQSKGSTYICPEHSHNLKTVGLFIKVEKNGGKILVVSKEGRNLAPI